MPDEFDWRNFVSEEELAAERQAHQSASPNGHDAAVEGYFAVELLTGANWLTRDIPEPDFLLGELLSTTSRIELIGPTGLGKTHFLLALAMAVGGGRDFLHWRGSTPRRVLFIDGEMSSRQAKKRLTEAARRNNGMPATLFYLNRDDFPNLQPLNTEAGQKFIDQIARDLSIEVIIFDNVQALLTGDMKDEEPWQQTLPWVRSLTQRGIGQIWAHHTGHDETHGYGTKTREWQLDAVALMERIERPEADIAFLLKFTKARERAPENRADFEPAVITLTDDAWMSEKGSLPSQNRKTGRDLALDVLNDEIARGNATIPSANTRIPPDTPCLDVGAWRKAFQLRSLSETKETDAKTKAAAERQFYRAANHLLTKSKQVGKFDNWVWPVR